jgi:hypothetical protein
MLGGFLIGGVVTVFSRGIMPFIFDVKGGEE